jgi:hypothetical protein
MAPLVAAYAGNTNNGTRRGAKNLPKLRRDLQELQKPVSDLGAGAGMMTRLATGATLTIGAVGGLGYAAYAASQKMREFSTSMSQLSNLARETGFSAGTINIRWLAKSAAVRGVYHGDREAPGTRLPIT